MSMPGSASPTAARGRAPVLAIAALGTLAILAGSADSSAQSAPAKPSATPAAKAPRKPAGVAAGKAPASAEFDRVSRDADAAREAGRLEEAVALYERALKIRPAWTEGHWYLGVTRYELDRYREARDAFRRVLVDQPENGTAWAFKGLCEFRLKDYETALSDLRSASSHGLSGRDQLSASVAYHTAIILTRLEQYDFALMSLQPFAHQGNDSPTVIEAFGVASLRMPLLPDEVPPDRREMVLLAGRGSYYLAARRPAAARAAFEELVSRYPDAPNVRFAYGVYLLQEDSDRAIEQFKKELESTKGNTAAILQIALEYMKRSDWEAARPWAAQAIELNPQDFAARRVIGQVLLETGDIEGAVKNLEIGVKLAPDSPSLRFTLARAYQRAGRNEDAERERAEFRRLERLLRTRTHGEQAVGGVSEPDSR